MHPDTSDILPADRPPNTGMRLALLIFALLAMAMLWAMPYFVEQWAYRKEKGAQIAIRESLNEMGDVKLEAINELFVSVAKRLNPSVVHIDTERSSFRRADEQASLYGQPGQQTRGEASGVIVDPTGYIVTNYHVISQASTIVVKLSGNPRDYVARVIGSDPKNDLAVIKIEASDLIAAPWGDSDNLRVGSLVWAMGNPFGLDNTLTFGIISAKERRGVNERHRYQDYLQTDAAVNPGNSGGPLVNMAGQIVGINTAIVGPTYQGISFAIPSNTARGIYEQIIAQGKVSNGFLGVGLKIMTEDIKRELNLPDMNGVIVTAVGPGTPAEAAGIQVGDIIRQWNGRAIEEPGALTYLVGRTPVGTRVPVVLIRKGREMTLQVTVAERPADSR
jgi:serine protease Do